MRKRRNLSLLLVIFFLYGKNIFAQSNGFRLIEGSCKSIIESLRKTQNNDSIAIEIFKEEYKIDKVYNVDNLLKKNYTQIIQFFYSEKGKNCHCQLKSIKKDTFPLIN
jgi:hypothetical protein